MNNTIRLLTFAAIVAASLSADIIEAPGLVSGGDYNSDWIGTYTNIPSYGTQSGSVAQLITTSANYDDLTLTVQLEDIDAGTVDFSLMTDVNGEPGAVLGTVVANIPLGTDMALTNYTMSFDPSLAIDGSYWLVATSPTVEPFMDQTQVPMWALAPLTCVATPDQYGDPLCNPPVDTTEVNYFGSWRAVPNQAFAFELDGIDPVAAPEPRWAFGLGLCLILVLLMFGKRVQN